MSPFKIGQSQAQSPFRNPVTIRLQRFFEKAERAKIERLSADTQRSRPIFKPSAAGFETASQGGVVSPLLANLFLHYAFDVWMARTFPHIQFERYADDIICHCKSAEEARALWGALADRFAACKLVLHPEKTKIVYCKDANRRGDFPNQSFDFLGFQFPSKENDLARAVPRARLHARRQPEGADGHQPDDPALGASSSQRQVPARSGPDVQSVHPRLDQLLRQLLSDAVASDPEEDRCSLSSAGHAASSSGFATRLKEREIGSRGFAAQNQRSSLIGSYVMATAEHREPCESRGSCTVVCPAKAGVFSRR